MMKEAMIIFGCLFFFSLGGNIGQLVTRFQFESLLKRNKQMALREFIELDTGKPCLIEDANIKAIVPIAKSENYPERARIDYVLDGKAHMVLVEPVD